jgi:hypothetical protein
LVAVLDADPMGEIAGLYELRGVIEIPDGGRDTAGEHNTNHQRGGFDQYKGNSKKKKAQQIDASKFTEGRKDTRVQIGWPSIETHQYGPQRFDGAVTS